MMQAISQEVSLSGIDFAAKVQDRPEQSEAGSKTFADILNSCTSDSGAGNTISDTQKASPEQTNEEDTLLSPERQEDGTLDNYLSEGTVDGSSLVLAMVDPQLLLQMQSVDPETTVQANTASIPSGNSAAPNVGLSGGLPSDLPPEIPANASPGQEGTNSLAETEEVPVQMTGNSRQPGAVQVPEASPSQAQEVTRENIPMTTVKEVSFNNQTVPQGADLTEAAGLKTSNVPEAENLSPKVVNNEETASVPVVTLAADQSEPKGKNSDVKNPVQTLNPEIKTDAVAEAGVDAVKGTESANIARTFTGDSTRGNDLAGGSGEINTQTTISVPTDSSGSEGDFVSRMSEVLQDQIIGKSELISQNGRAEISLELKPEYMGKLLLRLSLENGTLSAKFLVENHNVRELIENNMSQLKQNLADQGILWQEASVDVGNSGNSFSHQNTSGSGNGFFRYGTSGEGNLEIEEAALPLDGAPGMSISYLA